MEIILVAYCQDVNCSCLHRSGIVCRDDEEADYYASQGYLVVCEERKPAMEASRY